MAAADVTALQTAMTDMLTAYGPPVLAIIVAGLGIFGIVQLVGVLKGAFRKSK